MDTRKTQAAKFLDLLTEHGSLTYAQIATLLDTTANKVHDLVYYSVGYRVAVRTATGVAKGTPPTTTKKTQPTKLLDLLNEHGSLTQSEIRSRLLTTRGTVRDLIHYAVTFGVAVRTATGIRKAH